MLSHDSLFNYYETNFALMQHHKYSLTELDDMIPWEREIYVNLLMKWIKEENERIKEEERKSTAMLIIGMATIIYNLIIK